MKWKCELCGNCCEIFAPIVFGKECQYFNKETRKCDNYENRPQVCRTELAKLFQKNGIYLKGIDIEEYLTARCKLLKHLKNWKQETQNLPQGQKALLRAICNASLIQL